MPQALDAPHVGEGTYTFPEAARILTRQESHPSTRQLRSWMKSGLTPATHTDSDAEPILTFVDLISLEVVSRIRTWGASLQRIRKFEQRLREHYPELDRPFAHRIFFTDGHSLWTEMATEADDKRVLELLGSRPNQVAWRQAIETFAKQITFDGPNERASRWELSPWVEIDPLVQFGMPVVRGTRVRVSTVASNLKVGSVEEVGDWYGLSVAQVEGVRDYVALGN